MSRTERIESIIARRKPLAENINSIRSSIAKISSAYERMTPLCSAILNDESIVSEFPGMSEILASCEKPLNELQRLRGDLSLIQNRFSRDTLNIAVIGRARQGKSRLLQTITGLTSEEIPDGDKEFCTGVRSDIINDSNLAAAFAQVNFLTESSVYDFASMRLPEPGTFKASPEAATQMNLHLQHLKDLQEHLPQYQDYLGRSPMRIKRSQIREYVAQDLYLRVCKVFCV